MKTKEVLEGARDQILHLENYRSRPDLDDEPKPLTSTEGSLAMINMAIAEDIEQELLTRLYNLKNRVDILRDIYDINDHELDRLFEETDETLKKVIQ